MNTPGQPITISSQIHTYSELLRRIHDDLRIQHPEWLEPNGGSAICDSYEARLRELLEALTQRSAAQSIVDPNRSQSVEQTESMMSALCSETNELTKDTLRHQTT